MDRGRSENRRQFGLTDLPLIEEIPGARKAVGPSGGPEKHRGAVSAADSRRAQLGRYSERAT